jgi:hypothetical protein
MSCIGIHSHSQYVIVGCAFGVIEISWTHWGSCEPQTYEDIPMNRADCCVNVPYVSNILCNGQTTIACKLLTTGFPFGQPVQNLLRRLVRREDRIPNFDNFALDHGKSNSFGKFLALPVDSRQTQSLDKVQIFITEQFEWQVQPLFCFLLVGGWLRAQTEDFVNTRGHEFSLGVSE